MARKKLISCVCASTTYHEQLNGFSLLCFLSQQNQKKSKQDTLQDIKQILKTNYKFYFDRKSVSKSPGPKKTKKYCYASWTFDMNVNYLI